MIDPSGKVECVDGIFFKKGHAFNQGNIFTWDEDDFINGCEEAIKRYESNPVNSEGMKLADEFTFSKTLDEIQKVLHI